ncbi:MAG: hypothetical protein JW924_15225 [Fusobacteriaceae bacterium]|nr:hypothetical protein [Fusobacteriaceae bacterium]
MFIYTIVNIGSEKLLKEEVSIKYPHLKFAYSRPGFITFKDTNENFDINTKLDLIFARTYGLCIGKFTKENALIEIENYKNTKIHKFSYINENTSGEKAKINETILDFIELKEDEIWLGIKKIKNNSWKFPFGNPNIILPEESPSRAYLKISEAFSLVDFELKGQTVLELGSAPGGASYSMIQKGLKVYGVDNAEMADIFTSNSLFHHLKAPMQKIRDENIPRPCEVLVSDVNVMPSLILAQLKRFMSLRPGIKHVFYTLEIGDKISIKEVLNHVNTFKKFGFKEIIATQLPSNKSEILLYGKK